MNGHQQEKGLYNNTRACHLPWPVDSILDAVFTVSPNKQYRGILMPTTPATQGPVEYKTVKI